MPMREFFNGISNSSSKLGYRLFHQKAKDNSTDFIKNPSAPQNIVFDKSPTHQQHTELHHFDRTHSSEKTDAANRQYGQYIAKLSACQGEQDNSFACRREKMRLRKHNIVNNRS